MAASDLTHHGINYIEFSVTDLAQAKQFYESAFDWKFTDYGPGYAGIQKMNGEGEIGGLAVAETVSTGGPLVVLYSSQLEDSLQRVLAAGGVVTRDPFVFPGGRRFQFCDPSGNELGVWSQA